MKTGEPQQTIGDAADKWPREIRMQLGEIRRSIADFKRGLSISFARMLLLASGMIVLLATLGL